MLIGTKPQIEIPVLVEVEEGGKLRPVKFKGVFRRLTQKSSGDLQRRLMQTQTQLAGLARQLISLQDSQDDVDDELAQISQKIAELQQAPITEIREHLVGWKDLKGEGGVSVDFSEENLDLMLDYVPYVDGLTEALMKATGKKAIKEAKAKN